MRAVAELCVSLVLLAWQRKYRIASSSRARHASDLTAASQSDRAGAHSASSATHQVGLFTSRHVTCANCAAAFAVRRSGHVLAGVIRLAAKVRGADGLVCRRSRARPEHSGVDPAAAT